MFYIYILNCSQSVYTRKVYITIHCYLLQLLYIHNVIVKLCIYLASVASTLYALRWWDLEEILDSIAPYNMCSCVQNGADYHFVHGSPLRISQFKSFNRPHSSPFLLSRSTKRCSFSILHKCSYNTLMVIYMQDILPWKWELLNKCTDKKL